MNGEEIRFFPLQFTLTHHSHHSYPRLAALFSSSVRAACQKKTRPPYRRDCDSARPGSESALNQIAAMESTEAVER